VNVIDPINQPFIGIDWEDHLFGFENQRRELAASWKIMRSPQYMQLAGGSWRLRALGIPLWLADSALQGDIDMLMGTWTMTPDGPSDTIYRSFELKTSKVARDRKVSSLKRRGFHKTIGQLNKLWDLGSPQVFLLDAFILQSGYSHLWEGVPAEVAAEVKSRIGALTGRPQGYIAIGLEQVDGYPGNMAGVTWPVATMKPAGTQPLSGAIAEITRQLEKYQAEIGGFTMRRVISYCYECRKLTDVSSHGPHTCSRCSASLI
jgi:hypothetical protein